MQLKSMEKAHMRYLNDDWCVINVLLCKKIVCVYRMTQRKYSILRNNAYTIMGGVLNVLTGTSENQCQILDRLIHYVLVLLEKIKNQHGDKAIVCFEDLDDHDRLAKVVELIGQWLLKVIGYVKFGGARSEKFRGEVHVSSSSSQFFAILTCIQCTGVESVVHN